MIRASVAAAVIVLGGACGRSADVQPWLGPRAAVVRCSASGRLAPAPVIAGVPAPLPPSGLLARALDPVVLDELGYQRDAVVCATLEAPTDDDVAAAAATLAELVQVQEAAAREALRVGGRCTCEVARALDLRDLVPTCVDATTIAACDPSARAEAVAQALAPVLAAIERTRLPWTHWRLVGATDRPGWFVAHLDSLLAHHGGGSTPYLPSEKLSARVDPVVPILLEQPGVVAVIGQDGGRALLVVRELDGRLLLDHFTQPSSTSRRLPLVDRVELAQITAMVSALAPPAEPRASSVSPEGGMMVELDVALLEQIDRAAIASAVLGEGPYELEQERWDEPPRLFDRIAYQAPFGHQGQVLRVEHALSAAGVAWAQTLGDTPLIGNLGALGLEDRGPVFEPADPDVVFVLRGSDTARYAVHGIQQLPGVARALEIAAPGSLAGDLSHWRVDWPGSAPPSEQPTVLQGLRTELAARPYRIEATFDTTRTRLSIEARPR